VLSGRGLCDELITRPEESYQLCCVVVCDLETSRIGAPYIQGPPKKCIHTLTKEKSMLYVSTKLNYTSQVEYKLQ
jgi:hypothetical protein